jgi:hypothetical protein
MEGEMALKEDKNKVNKFYGGTNLFCGWWHQFWGKVLAVLGLGEI